VKANQSYQTISASLKIINKIKDSRFIASASPCRDREAAEAFITEIREKHDDATHNVSAYRIYESREILEYSDDDGEPAGSSGPPVLAKIDGHNLVNTCVVVTRYFGGTKLGIGGLIKAYGNSCERVLLKADKIKLSLFYLLICRGDYQYLGPTLGQLEKVGAEIKGTRHVDKGFSVEAVVRASSFTSLSREITRITGDRVKLTKKESKFLPD